jgi:hypothetical protein
LLLAKLQKKIQRMARPLDPDRYREEEGHAQISFKKINFQNQKSVSKTKKVI